jgi:hypothetical protein
LGNASPADLIRNFRRLLEIKVGDHHLGHIFGQILCDGLAYDTCATQNDNAGHDFSPYIGSMID